MTDYDHIDCGGPCQTNQPPVDQREFRNFRETWNLPTPHTTEEPFDDSEDDLHND